MKTSDHIAPAFVRFLVKTHMLTYHSPHGISHWHRVLRNGLDIADHVDGVNRKVLTLFAYLHDSERIDEGKDIEHGLRASRLIESYATTFPDAFTLTPEELDELQIACAFHSDGHIIDTHDSPTIAACWDADRLDLPRVGITVAPHVLSTEYARKDEVMAAADERALAWRYRRYAAAGLAL